MIKPLNTRNTLKKFYDVGCTENERSEVASGLCEYPRGGEVMVVCRVEMERGSK